MFRFLFLLASVLMMLVLESSCEHYSETTDNYINIEESIAATSIYIPTNDTSTYSANSSAIKFDNLIFLLNLFVDPLYG